MVFIEWNLIRKIGGERKENMFKREHGFLQSGKSKQGKIHLQGRMRAYKSQTLIFQFTASCIKISMGSTSIPVEEENLCQNECNVHFSHQCICTTYHSDRLFLQICWIFGNVKGLHLCTKWKFKANWMSQNKDLQLNQQVEKNLNYLISNSHFSEKYTWFQNMLSQSMRQYILNIFNWRTWENSRSMLPFMALPPWNSSKNSLNKVLLLKSAGTKNSYH